MTHAIDRTGYSELVLHGLVLENPPGAYLHDNILECDSIRIRFSTFELISAFAKKKKKFYSFPTIDIRFLEIRGLRCRMEIAKGSEFADYEEEVRPGEKPAKQKQLQKTQ